MTRGIWMKEINQLLQTYKHQENEPTNQYRARYTVKASECKIAAGGLVMYLFQLMSISISKMIFILFYSCQIVVWYCENETEVLSRQFFRLIITRR